MAYIDTEEQLVSLVSTATLQSPEAARGMIAGIVAASREERNTVALESIVAHLAEIADHLRYIRINTT